MKTKIYFYTGTGNSLWTAKKLAEKLGDTELIPITLTGKEPMQPSADKIGFIFPVHIWGIPSPVVDFLDRLKAGSSGYYFAVAVHAGQVAATLLQLKKMLEGKNIKLSSGFSVCMPSNYIPWGGADSQDKQRKRFDAALDKITNIASFISAGKEMPPEKGPAWQNIFLSAIYRSSYDRVPRMDKPFYADEKCTGCGICEKICPAQNISLVDKKPAWLHRCEQCFACLQWCPEEAIQYGKGTIKRKRYRHPEITLKDMLACIPEKTR